MLFRSYGTCAAAQHAHGVCAYMVQKDTGHSVFTLSPTPMQTTDGVRGFAYVAALLGVDCLALCLHKLVESTHGSFSTESCINSTLGLDLAALHADLGLMVLSNSIAPWLCTWTYCRVWAQGMHGFVGKAIVLQQTLSFAFGRA